MPYQGLIEVHGPKTISGWCVEPGNPTAAAVELGIWWKDICLRKILAEGYRPDIDRGYNAKKSQFRLQIGEDLNKLLPENTALSVTTPDGARLPLYKPERISYLGEATDGGVQLRNRLAKGFIINKWGCLKLPFSAMPTRQREAYVRGLVDLSAYFYSRFGLTLFPHYGTLLGYARDGEFLPHDDDTDCSYIVEYDFIEQVADHFFDMADMITADGHSVIIESTCQMHVTLKGRDHIGADIFTSWKRSDGKFYTYFGVCGEFEPGGFLTDKLEGAPLNIPVNYERLLEITYGPDWRVPDSNFQWRVPGSIRDTMDAMQMLGRSRKALFSQRNQV